MAKNKHPKRKLALKMRGAKVKDSKGYKVLPFFSKAWLERKDGIEDRAERQAGAAHKRAIVRRKDYKPIISRSK